MPVIRIEQIEDPRLEDYRNVSDAELLRRRRLFVGEGRLVVRRLLAGGHRVVSLLVNDASLRSLEQEHDRVEIPDALPVYVCPTAALADILGFNFHRGCLALAERPPDRDAVEVVRSAKLVLVLDGVTDADNVGSAFRNAAAFGVDAVFLSACCDPLYRKAVRTSMGSVLMLPYARVASPADGLGLLRSEGFTLAALTPRGAIDVSDYARRLPRPEKIALVVGSEGAGISPDAEAIADARVRIPMRNGVDSLNLATAAGIALHALAGPPS